jgi:hypothetical protein
MGQQLNVTGKMNSPSESNYLLSPPSGGKSGEWVKSVVLDPKRRDLAMSRDIGPNRCTLHSALMTCG